MLERSVFSDRHVFVRAVHENAWLSEAELQIYDSWFHPFIEYVCVGVWVYVGVCMWVCVCGCVYVGVYGYGCVWVYMGVCIWMYVVSLFLFLFLLHSVHGLYTTIPTPPYYIHILLYIQQQHHPSHTPLTHSTHPDLVPDGFIYMRADPETCLRRMHTRSRTEESSVPLNYLESLHLKHEEWLLNGSMSVAQINNPLGVGVGGDGVPVEGGGRGEGGGAVNGRGDGLLLVKPEPEAIRGCVRFLRVGVVCVRGEWALWG